MSEKLIIIVLSVIAIAAIGGIVFLSMQNKQMSQEVPTNTSQTAITTAPTQTNSNQQSSPAVSQTATGFCTPSQLTATGTMQPAAGNIYGTFTITNKSQTPCQIQGNNQLQLQYPNSVNNITVVQQGQPAQNSYTLLPTQSVYATLRAPNGPQCNSTIENPNVAITYQIAPNTSVTFMNGTTTDPFELTTCEAYTDMTTVTVSPFSTQKPN